MQVRYTGLICNDYFPVVEARVLPVCEAKTRLKNGNDAPKINSWLAFKIREFKESLCKALIIYQVGISSMLDSRTYSHRRLYLQ